MLWVISKEAFLQIKPHVQPVCNRLCKENALIDADHKRGMWYNDKFGKAKVLTYADDFSMIKALNQKLLLHV